MISAGFPTHPSYLSVPAETWPHPSFFFYSSSHFLFFSFFKLDIWLDELWQEHIRRHLCEKKRWQPLSLLFPSFLFAAVVSYFITRSNVFVLFLNMWFAETAHSICGSSFYWRADLVPRLQGGKGTEGKTCLCEFVSVGHQEGSKLCSLHRRRSFLTLNDFWLKVYSDVNKRNVCRGHAGKKKTSVI